MSPTKQTFVTAFALFSLFFGAGNLILPPLLGYNAGEDWWIVLIGFGISAVFIPILAIYAYARLQGTMLDFANKVSPLFAIIYAALIYVISISLPSPRTASVTYEMAVQPYVNISSLGLSILYFSLVLVFVLNRHNILSLIGKFLTPLILIILILIVGIGLTSAVEPMKASIFDSTFSMGILEGYQTFDAIGGVVVGGVIVISFALQGKYNYLEKKKMIAKAGLIAGLGIFLIYGGLIALGAHYSGTIEEVTRTQLLIFLSTSALGSIGSVFLSVLVALACFTTAVGIVTGTSDFVKGLTGNSKTYYIITAIIGCIIGVVMGQFNVRFIIDIALPVLILIYPITIVLIILNATPEKWSKPEVFKAVVLITLLFSLPEFLQFFIAEEKISAIQYYIPYSKYSLGWVIPAGSIFILMNLLSRMNLFNKT